MNNIFKSGAGECSKCRQLPCDWLKDIGETRHGEETGAARDELLRAERQRSTDTYSKAIKSVASSAARRVAHFRIFFFSPLIAKRGKWWLRAAAYSKLPDDGG
jgi:hypothetical protein